MLMAAQDWTYGYYGFVLTPAEAGSKQSLASKGKNLQKVIDCHLKYFQMSAFERESKRRELAFTSGFFFCYFFFFSGYHLPQMLVNPKFCLFAGPSGFYFLTPPQLSPRLWLLLFVSLTPWCILHTLASRMFIFSLGNRWDKEKLLVWPDAHLAPKGESGFWFFLPERGFWAEQPCWDFPQVLKELKAPTQ